MTDTEAPAAPVRPRRAPQDHKSKATAAAKVGFDANSITWDEMEALETVGIDPTDLGEALKSAKDTRPPMRYVRAIAWLVARRATPQNPPSWAEFGGSSISAGVQLLSTGTAPDPL